MPTNRRRAQQHQLSRRREKTPYSAQVSLRSLKTTLENRRRHQHKTAYFAQMKVGMPSNTTWKKHAKRRVDATLPKDAIFSAGEPWDDTGHNAGKSMPGVAKPTKDAIFTTGDTGMPLDKKSEKQRRTSRRHSWRRRNKTLYLEKMNHGMTLDTILINRRQSPRRLLSRRLQKTPYLPHVSFRKPSKTTLFVATPSQDDILGTNEPRSDIGQAGGKKKRPKDAICSAGARRDFGNQRQATRRQ